MMNIIKILTWIVPKRLKSTWILLSITSFGVLASVTLLSVGLLYSNALAEGGLRHTFALASPSTLNIEIQIKARPMGFADYESLDQTVKKHYRGKEQSQEFLLVPFSWDMKKSIGILVDDLTLKPEEILVHAKKFLTEYSNERIGNTK